MMKKIGTPARASGEVRSTTREPASMPALVTEKTAYASFETEILLETSLGRRLMAGSKTDLDQTVWQTMEHSSGVTLMLRKPCWLSRVRSGQSGSEDGGWGP